MHIAVLLTLLGMAAVTYATRISGFLLLHNRTLGARTRAVLEAAPGCVLISVIAPHFVSSHPAELIALGVTVLAASKLPMLATVALGVASLALLNQVVGAW